MSLLRAVLKRRRGEEQASLSQACPGRLSCAHIGSAAAPPPAAGVESVALPDGSEGLRLLVWAGA